MKITYLSHATLLIETEGLRIITDPWVLGSTYCNQWHLFPKPVSNFQEELQRIDVVLISHGHEDHIHHETLKLIDKKATVYYPFTWFTGAVNYFKSIGFQKVIEAKNNTTYLLNKKVKVTFLANNLDNTMVIEDGKRVLVDINDSLPSASEFIIDFFLKKITKRWKQIDYLFSSYGGASYFPNTIKFKEKNDFEVGRLREQYFLNNFCKIAQTIGAKFSIPFATDFVLLDDSQRWINDVKFPRYSIIEYFNQYFNSSSTSIKELYTGDYIVDDQVFLNSYFHHKKPLQQNINQFIEQHYKAEIQQKREEVEISEEMFNSFLNKLNQQILKKKDSLPKNLIEEGLWFVIQLVDYKKEAFIEVEIKKETLNISLIDEVNSRKHTLLFKTKSEIITYSIENEWGGDAIIIGYGCEIEIFDRVTIEKGVDNAVVHLLSNYPYTSQHIKREPFRAVNYLLHDGLKRRVMYHKLIGKKQEITSNDVLHDNEMWLTRSKCDICRVCDMPLMNDENAKYL